ncbi:MAG: hypothetical protein WCK58_11300 [Chloroflexota bacterium]
MTRPERAVREAGLEKRARSERTLLGQLVAEYLFLFLLLVFIGGALLLASTGALGPLVHSISFTK